VTAVARQEGGMKLVIDTDPGVDDAMAILYAALSPEIELLGLTTIFGNVPVDKATRNALRLVEHAGLNIPVAEGAAVPLVMPANPHAAVVHGEEGFGHMPALEPKGRAIARTAAEFLCDMARAHKGELVVCAIGPITNVALAIQRDPEFVRNVARIVLMGGAYGVPGNVTPHAEANTWNDPHALNVVIGSGAEVVMVGLDVTMQTMCDDAFFDGLAAAHPAFGGFLREASHFYLDFYETFVGTRWCSLHDPAAVIACTHPEMFQMQRVPVIVVEKGEEIGRTMPGGPEAGHILVCTGGDMEAVKRRFSAAFGA